MTPKALETMFAEAGYSGSHVHKITETIEGNLLIESDFGNVDPLQAVFKRPQYHHIEPVGDWLSGKWLVVRSTKALIERDIIQLQESIQEMLASIEHRKQEIEMLKAFSE